MLRHSGGTGMLIRTSCSPDVVHIITGLGSGGAEAVLFRLLTHDRSVRHAVISLTDSGKYGPLLQEQNIEIICLDMPRGRLTVRGLWRSWRTLRRWKPAVVQTWMYHADLVGGVMARLAGCRKVVWGIRHTTLDPQKSSRGALWAVRVCARLSSVVPARIVCCAEEGRRVHVALGYRASKMTVIANGYDLREFKEDAAQRETMRDALGISCNALLIGLVGRFDPQKDHENLLYALQLLRAAGRQIRCVLVGTELEPGNGVLRRLLDRYGVQEQVLLLGQRSDIPAIMNAIDLHVLSSYSEAFPNVIAEAMACGTPCVTTDVGDAARIVGDTGWVVPPRDAEALAEAIAKALDTRGADAQAWQARRTACRLRIERNFSIERMVARYHEVWGLEGMKNNAGNAAGADGVERRSK